jgi:tetratricopeptide (TPR) repeat protein
MVKTKKHEEELKEIKKIMSVKNRFFLILCVFNHYGYRDEIIKELGKEVSSIVAKLENFETFQHVKGYLRENEPFDLIHLVTNKDFFDELSFDFFLQINNQREIFSSQFPKSVIFWFKDNELRDFTLNSADMWHWRAGIYDFKIKIEKEDKDYALTPLISAIKIDSLYYHKDKIKKRISEISAYLEENKEANEELKNNFYKELAKLYYNLGNYNSSKKYILKNIEFYKNKNDLIGIARCYDYLAGIYRILDKIENALYYQLKAIKIREDILDNNHPDLATSYNNLALIYQNLNKLEDALKYQLKAIEIEKKVLEKNHPNLSSSYNNISVIYLSLGEFENALKYQLEAIKIGEEVLEKNHPNFALSYNSLALIYRKLGKLEDALNYQLKAIEIREEILENNHPMLAISYNNLGLIYFDLKKRNKAIEFAEKAVKILEYNFPDGHYHLDNAKKTLEKFLSEPLIDAETTDCADIYQGNQNNQ